MNNSLKTSSGQIDAQSSPVRAIANRLSEVKMKSLHLNIKPIVIALFAAGVLSACGGGGGGGGGTAVDPGQTPPTNNPPGGNPPPGNNPDPDPGTGGSPDTAMTMSCVDGAQFDCSGGTVLKTDNGVMLTRSGVQVFGLSASDLSGTPADPTTLSNPRGFVLPSAAPDINGFAEIRIAKDDANAITQVGLLLNDFGLSWDGTTTRPPIIETFAASRSRAELDSANKLVVATLPLGTETSFFDRTTQRNYANNTYRADPAQRIDNNPLGAGAGGWSTPGGIQWNWAATSRVHEDGDVDAPTSDAAGTKGYRGFTNLSYEFANISAWNSQDTVNIADWNAQPRIEHNKERRGIVAFGDVTSPDAVPTSGTATYTGKIYGVYGLAALTQDDPDTFEGRATVTVDYATGTATIAVTDTLRYEQRNGDVVEVPVNAAFDATASRGSVSVNGADKSAPNYFTGTVTGGFTGGVSGRYFGPNAKEVGGTFHLTGAGGVNIIGGFLGRKP